jgi:threonine dehydrogenase-like Zn-dependent dehydrogenase
VMNSPSSASAPATAPMAAALEGAWAAIRSRHPEVPAVVIVLGAGSIGRGGRRVEAGALRRDAVG